METDVILRELRRQNHFVFRKLFEQHYKELVQYAHGYIFDESRCEDMVQEVFISLWEKAATIEINKSLKSYLYSMVRNRCLNHLKSIKITDDAKVLELQAVLDNSYDLDAFSENDKAIIHNQVLKILETLPDKMQQIVRLRFVNNAKYSEIAEELGISVNTVKTQLKRAKIKISQLLKASLILLSIYP